MSEFTIHTGDCLTVLQSMPDGSINTCVTSPPYFGLRDYGHEGQIGLEPTPDEFVAKLVAVFREVKRVLRDDGTLWLNLGDSYAGSGNYRGVSEETLTSKQRSNGGARGVSQLLGSARKDVGLEQKQLMGIPWRVAFALQADGWYLRQDIIWHKPNPMPESVRDRCTKAHEYIFLLSKQARYYYDIDAVKEEATGRDPGNLPEHKYDGQPMSETKAGLTQIMAADTRNRRSVWSVTTQPFKEAHFATFPPDLIRPCILAGCPENGTVLDPFNGAGTTGVVCMEESRNYVGIELNPEYVAMAERRIREAQPKWFGEIA